ncbi:MAG TPA: hypothetical protein VLD36_19065 [Burkholderiales bacterium]|nr:hypothetical protein [Burkholderiales bacterium]
MRKIVGTAALGLAAALAGCAWLGPEIIRSGRPAYNDAILTTNDEQLLQNIVRLRFGDSVGFLTVSSVTANVSVRASGTVNVGAGPASNYAGNLVPIAGTLTTEQNPTISYTPVSGDSLVRQFAAEVPLDLAILMINLAHSQEAAWTAIVRRVNNFRNPEFLHPPTLVTDPRFLQIAALAGELQRRGTLYWVRLAGAQTGYAVVLHSYSPHNSREVARLLDLLGIQRPLREGDDVVIPVRLSVGSPDPGAIAIETRSLLELMRLAAASIELPADAVGAIRYPVSGPAGRGIHIHVAAERPAQARVAVEYRGRWYFIANEDELSKQWFSMLQLLAGAQTPSTGVGPVLTVPVTGGR